MTLLDDLLVDLKAESDRLWNAVSGLDDAGWATPTPAPGWSLPPGDSSDGIAMLAPARYIQ